ncbi:helix-turn-helix transcriptional regulator [Paenibacillus sp. M1]|uniref:Helix-turn-helix transcriptional regulator n=1 Tax=Paenibacillus haidiansis TaxID=1574488 RepID=A0ABU7W0Z2_9BACL
MKRDLTPTGVIIKKRLIETGKTQYQLAAEVGTSSNYLYLIMIGERSGRSYIGKIAEALGIESKNFNESVSA